MSIASAGRRPLNLLVASGLELLHRCISLLIDRLQLACQFRQNASIILFYKRGPQEYQARSDAPAGAYKSVWDAIKAPCSFVIGVVGAVCTLCGDLEGRKGSSKAFWGAWLWFFGAKVCIEPRTYSTRTHPTQDKAQVSCG